MSQPQPASQILKSVLDQAGSRAKRARFADALQRSLDPATARHCQVIGFRGGKLTVEVDSAPLCAELTCFHRDETRRRMNEILPGDRVARIDFRMGGTAHV